MIKTLACVILGQNETWKILQNRSVVCQEKDWLNQRTAGVILQDEFQEQQSKILKKPTKHFNTSVQKLI